VTNSQTALITDFLTIFFNTGTWLLQVFWVFPDCSATPDLWLPSQPQSVTAHWSVSNYTDWWQRKGVNNCPKSLRSGALKVKANWKLKTLTHVSGAWLTEGLTFHSTQNRSFQRRSSPANLLTWYTEKQTKPNTMKAINAGTKW